MKASEPVRAVTENRASSTRDADANSPLPLEDGLVRVQRMVGTLRPVHLERAVPASADWRVRVTGMVESDLSLSIEELRSLPAVEREIDFHCVTGWSRPGTRWRGVALADIFERAQPRAGATHVSFHALDSPYSACLPIEEALDGMIALDLDSEPIPRLNGGPVRYVPPAHLWAYKGVKWLGGISLGSKLEPGLWEALVGDVAGRVPEGVLELFEEEADRP